MRIISFCISQCPSFMHRQCFLHLQTFQNIGIKGNFYFGLDSNQMKSLQMHVVLSANQVSDTCVPQFAAYHIIPN